MFSKRGIASNSNLFISFVRTINNIITLNTMLDIYLVIFLTTKCLLIYSTMSNIHSLGEMSRRYSGGRASNPPNIYTKSYFI